MHKEGHIGAALLVYSPLGLFAMLLADSQLAFIGAVVAAGLAMLPDMDMRIPLLKHRGPTHTVWFALGVGVVLAIFGGQGGADAGAVAAFGGALFGLLLGTGTVVSHIAADALTPAGVRPFWPLRDDEYKVAIARASNPLANYALLGIGSGVAVLALIFGRALVN
jgi:inner membrane protein